MPQDPRMTEIDDGRKDLIIGDHRDGGAKIIITQEILEKYKLNYDDFKNNGIELGKLLMTFGLMLVKMYTPEKIDEPRNDGNPQPDQSS